mmetsp:Transcript_34177/g.53426  ORF Transcript_34177/g.53426 Transcript_34177/m.53426 type:complete len:296 (+) Transcript_34177:38-925(+)
MRTSKKAEPVIQGSVPSLSTNSSTPTATTSRRNKTREFSRSSSQSFCATLPPTSKVQTFHGEWDEEGVYVYQAFNDQIAEHALEHQKFGGELFNPQRMTWIKPSFAWVLYRSGYAKKHNQTRILKIKLPHEAMAEILSRCTCIEAGFRSDGTCPDGRIQWDPARDLMVPDKKVPRKMISTRAIQIGLARSLSAYYVENTIKIEDVTPLAASVFVAHRAKKRNMTKVMMEELIPMLPQERPYLPLCPDVVLERLAMLPGPGAEAVSQIGRGKVELAPATPHPPCINVHSSTKAVGR